MPQQMFNLDYHFLALELQRELEGGRFNKAYAISPTRFRFRFHKEGEKNLVIDLGIRTHLTRFIEEGVEPAGFVKYLREHLDNARVNKVSQLGFDRVLQFELEKKQRFKLVLEQFAEGNMLLLDEKGVILATLKKEEWATRKLAQGIAYALPPSAKKHPASVVLEDLKGLKGGVVPALSKIVNLAPFYLEEVAARAGLQFREEVSKLTAEQKARLVEAFGTLLNNFQPALYHKDFEPIAFAPIRLQKLSGVQFIDFETFSDALDEFFFKHKVEAKLPSVGSKKVQKLEHQLEQQRKALESFERAESEARAAGDAIYSNFQLVEGLLKFVREQREKKTADAQIDKELEKVSKGRARYAKGVIEVEV